MRRISEMQRFEFEKLFKTIHTVLTAVPRLLVPAKRRTGVEGAAIDIDLTCVDTSRNLRALQKRCCTAIQLQSKK